MKRSVAVALILLALAVGYLLGGGASVVKEAEAGPRSAVQSHIDRSTRVACYYNEAGISCVNVDRLPDAR